MINSSVHFPDLLQIAVPGPFLFCGNIPEDMQQAAIGMGLDATFASNILNKLSRSAFFFRPLSGAYKQVRTHLIDILS